jgi:hypothetical protein
MTIFVTFAGRQWREVTFFVSPVGFLPHPFGESPIAANEFTTPQNTVGDWMIATKERGMQKQVRLIAFSLSHTPLPLLQIRDI